MPSWGWMAVGAGAVVLLYVFWVYNRLVGLSKRADAAWSDIDVQLKRRWDLVPALVETVKGYARHEQETLEGAVSARNEASHAGSISERGASEHHLSQSVTRLFALAEAYPDLKANQNFLDLQKNLVEVEDQVQYARRYYNAVTRDMNTLIQRFPEMLIARPAGFDERPFFQLDDDSQRAAPAVRI